MFPPAGRGKVEPTPSNLSVDVRETLRIARSGATSVSLAYAFRAYRHTDLTNRLRLVDLRQDDPSSFGGECAALLLVGRRIRDQRPARRQ